MDKDQKHIPFAVIVAVTNGDETAIQEILNFYDGYISKLSLRKLYDEYLNNDTLAWCGSAHRNENGESPVELPKPSDCFGNTQ